jgi:hypothetical protein
MEKSRMKYVLIKKFETGEEAVSIIEDPIELFKGGTYKEANGDKLYQLGPEVTVEITIKVASATRSKESTFKNSFPHGLKGDLGVGEYYG